jgi:hypothetical protein
MQVLELQLTEALDLSEDQTMWNEERPCTDTSAFVAIEAVCLKGEVTSLSGFAGYRLGPLVKSGGCVCSAKCHQAC